MPQTSLGVGNFNVITIRLEPTSVRGSGSPAWPRLCLPFQIQLLPAGPQNQPGSEYVLLRLAGRLSAPSLPEFTDFEWGPLAEQSRPAPYFRSLSVDVQLDRVRIRQFEDARAGTDAHLVLYFSGLVWYAQKFQTVQCDSSLEVAVPRSHWADRVLPLWGLSDVRVVEITFPKSETGENFRAAHLRVEAAEKLFANAQYKQALAELYSSFEGLANSMGFAKPDQQFFAGLLGELHPAKKAKAKLALDYLCEFLQLGRHEVKEAPESFAISRSDARFALIMSQAVLEYITPKG